MLFSVYDVFVFSIEFLVCMKSAWIRRQIDCYLGVQKNEEFMEEVKELYINTLLTAMYGTSHPYKLPTLLAHPGGLVYSTHVKCQTLRNES